MLGLLTTILGGGWVLEEGELRISPAQLSLARAGAELGKNKAMYFGYI